MSEDRSQDKNKAEHRPEQAAAVQYCAQTGEPRILAMGVGDIARKIVELAEQNSVPVRQDGEIVRLLGKLESRGEVPEAAESLLAEILCFLYAADRAYLADKPDLPALKAVVAPKS